MKTGKWEDLRPPSTHLDRSGAVGQWGNAAFA
jgi:hypothetical protein